MELKIIKNEHCKSYKENPFRKGGFCSKFKDDSLEINIVETYPSDTAPTSHLRVPTDPKAKKTYFVISGKLECVATGCKFEQGDILVLTYESEPVSVRVLEPTKILVQSYYDNTFLDSVKQNESINNALMEVQLKDSYTYFHCMEVGRYVEAIAIKLGYTGRRLRDISWAAKYHDVGKIAIDSSILNKPGKLTDVEWDIMKGHVVLGEGYIVEAFGKSVYDLSSSHHERVDGSGYPRGLVGDEICEEARIIAICDSYEAMTSDRVYKKGKSMEEAFEELKALSKIKYDQRLVDIALPIIKELVLGKKE